MTRPVNTLLWLLAGVLLVRLGLSALIPFMDTTEARYGEIARIMAESGDWITPWFDAGVPFWGKPPLSFWAQALSFRVFGVNEFAGRLPSWLANLGVVWLVFRAGTALRPDLASTVARSNGLWAALIYATTALGFVSAGTVMTDSFLALGTSLTLCSLVLRLSGATALWGWGFFAGLAIGLLAKGPLALVLTGIPVFIWALVCRQWRTLWQCLPWLRGTLALLATVLPWYVLAELKTPGFLDYFIVGEHIRRFVISNWQGDLYGNAHQFTRGTIWLYLLLASCPWGVFLISALFRKKPGRDSAPETPALPQGLIVLTSASALTPALFFTFSGNILWTYVLPGLPFLAIMVARYWPLSASGLPARSTMAAVWLIPLVAVSISVWVSIHPEQLKTEKFLMDRIAEKFGEQAGPVYFLDQEPFSARFYGRGRTQVLSSSHLEHFADNHWSGQQRLVAVKQRDRDAIRILEHRARAVDQDRRYIVYYLPATKDRISKDTGNRPVPGA